MIPALLSRQTLSSFSETGSSFVIRCSPDIFTCESFNLGVCVIGNDGNRLGKIITEPGRLNCLYGAETARGILQLAQVALCSAIQGEKSPSENIVFDAPKPIYNVSPLEALDDLFSSQVTVAISSRPSATTQRLPQMPTNKVIAKIYSHLRLTHSDQSNNIIPDAMQNVLKTRKGTRAVTIPLQPTAGGGIIESAAYSATTLRSHLLSALLDLEWAAEARQLNRLGFFIVPPSNWPADKMPNVNRTIDEIVERIPTRIRVEVDPDIDQMCAHILQWGKAA